MLMMGLNTGERPGRSISLFNVWLNQRRKHLQKHVYAGSSELKTDTNTLWCAGCNMVECSITVSLSPQTKTGRIASC